MSKSKKKLLPADPENMNEDRAAWAGTALDTFQEATGTDPEDAVSDLIADLHHWCDRNGIDFNRELERAAFHYDAETGGEE